MHVIAKISVQKRNSERYNVFLLENGKEVYRFSVDEKTLIDFNLRKGMTLENKTIEAIQQKDDQSRAYNMSIRYLSYRMRTKKEMSDYLEKKEIDEETIQPIIEKLEIEGLLDDGAFADAFVSTRINTSTKGPQFIKRELMQKGVTASDAEAAITKYTYEKQLDKLIKWVSKNFRPTSKKSFQDQVRSMKTSLMQKGFSQDVIQEAIKEADLEKDEDHEYEALRIQGEKFARKYSKKDSGYLLQQKVKAALFRKGFDSALIDRFLNEHLES
ncbi:regulatory protein [Gracilibacillus halotolerans]|uniref:Regulatory protein RecX n=1 Tax=Gracilibacillus halotolerans TaxID=74386 RepID=A0A841RPH1_9BACI|nr:recombination regulator RecX [Gracilibacillus halotolerans]MBB6513523.1 regulatory protein [Gracilibacillus halotolerans]